MPRDIFDDSLVALAQIGLQCLRLLLDADHQLRELAKQLLKRSAVQQQALALARRFEGARVRSAKNEALRSKVVPLPKHLEQRVIFRPRRPLVSRPTCQIRIELRHQWHLPRL